MCDGDDDGAGDDAAAGAGAAAFDSSSRTVMFCSPTLLKGGGGGDGGGGLRVMGEPCYDLLSHKAFSSHAEGIFAAVEGLLRQAVSPRAAEVLAPSDIKRLAFLCRTSPTADWQADPGPLFVLVRDAAPAAAGQVPMYSLLCSLAKLSTCGAASCSAPGLQAFLCLTAINRAASFLRPPLMAGAMANVLAQANAKARAAAAASSKKKKKQRKEGESPLQSRSVLLLPCLVVLGRGCLQWAQLMQQQDSSLFWSVAPVLAPQAELALQWLQSPNTSEELSEAGYAEQVAATQHSRRCDAFSMSLGLSAWLECTCFEAVINILACIAMRSTAKVS